MAAEISRITACTAHHPLPDGAVDLLGAVRAVTGAMTRVNLGGGSVLVDCGVAQGEEARRWRMPDQASEVDAVILTHGHNDHVGSLPALVERGWQGPIFGTHATLAVAEVVLADGLRLGGAADREIAGFLRRLRALTRPVAYGTGFRPLPAHPEVESTLHEAGHILGSSSVELTSARSRVMLSGDLGRPGTPILPDYNTRWSSGRPIDVAVMEATYGSRNHAGSHQDVERDLERIVKRAVADGGHILVPAFAIGRTQLLLYHLNTLVEAGRLPDVLVAVDTPMGLRITELYHGSKHLFDRQAAAKLAAGDDPLDFENLYGVSKARDSVRLRDIPQPTIIIAGSGMCTGGRIVGHLKELLPRPETCVVFAGYQAHGTPGRRIQTARSGDRIRLDGEEIPVRASIETLSGLSAHADRDELWTWAGNLPAVRVLALHHGEPEEQEAFKTWAENQLGGAPASRPDGGV